MSGFKYIRFFEEVGIADVELVGGKNASLGEMYRELSDQGVLVPHGFAITADAYRYMLDAAGAIERLKTTLEGMDETDVADLARRGKRAREIVYGAGLPADLAAEISRVLPAPAGRVRRGRQPGRPQLGDRRGSAHGELRRSARDLPEHQGRGEPAGRLPPVLRQPVHGPRDPLPGRPGVRPLRGGPVDRRDEDGAFRSRRVRGVLLARHRVGVPRRRLHHGRLRARGERRAGRGRSGRVLRPQADIRAAGIGRCSGGCWATRRSRWCSSRARSSRPSATSPHRRPTASATASTTRTCSSSPDYAIKIERHYGRPMDMEWAKDGLDGKLYVVQARPETVASQRQPTRARELRPRRERSRGPGRGPRGRREDRRRARRT